MTRSAVLYGALCAVLFSLTSLFGGEPDAQNSFPPALVPVSTPRCDAHVAAASTALVSVRQLQAELETCKAGAEELASAALSHTVQLRASVLAPAGLLVFAAGAAVALATKKSGNSKVSLAGNANEAGPSNDGEEQDATPRRGCSNLDNTGGEQSALLQPSSEKEVTQVPPPLSTGPPAPGTRSFAQGAARSFAHGAWRRDHDGRLASVQDG